MAKIVTITNPLTGQPAQVDQLDHTAQQIDDGLNISRGVSNPNLLDNWYFSNPIDQRQGRVVVPSTTYYSDNQLTTSAGTTSAYVTAYRYATGTASGVSYASFKLEDSDTAPTYYAAPENVVRGYTGTRYGIDRWDLFGGTNPTMLIENGHIRLTGSGFFRQIIPVSQIPRGTVVTMSILMASGDLYALTTTVPDNQVDSPQVFFPGGFLRIFGRNADTDVYFIWFDGEVSPVAMKLELGTQQTLAHQENGVWVLNEIPDYGEQLARCQRYALALSKQSGHSVYGSGMINSGQNARIVVPLPVTMRTAPTVTKLGDLEIIANGTAYAVTSVSVETLSPSAVCLLVNSASLSTTQAAAPALLRSYGGGKGELFLSADL